MPSAAHCVYCIAHCKALQAGLRLFLAALRLLGEQVAGPQSAEAAERWHLSRPLPFPRSPSDNF